MGALGVSGDSFFALLYLRSQDEVLGFEYLRDGLVYLRLDRGVLRFQVKQWNLHTWFPLLVVCRVCGLCSIRPEVASLRPDLSIAERPPRPLCSGSQIQDNA